MVSALSTGMSYAADGTINFTGSILDAACTIDIGSGNTMTVNLGNVAKSAFSAAGAQSSVTKFTIKLKSCPGAVTSAKIKFDGTSDSTNSGLLAIGSGTGNARGVAIRLMTADKNNLPLNELNQYSYTLAENKVNELNFYAAYQATSATVVAGTTNAVSNFTINYN